MNVHVWRKSQVDYVGSLNVFKKERFKSCVVIDFLKLGTIIAPSIMLPEILEIKNSTVRVFNDVVSSMFSLCWCWISTVEGSLQASWMLGDFLPRADHTLCKMSKKLCTSWSRADNCKGMHTALYMYPPAFVNKRCHHPTRLTLSYTDPVTGRSKVCM